MEDEDTLIERKKQELKKWFTHNYQHELNQKMHLQNISGGNNQGSGSQNNVDLSFQNLVQISKEIDAKTTPKKN
jgi:hypothetical protein